MRPVHKEIFEIQYGESDDRYSSPKKARKKAMDFLARREYGRSELVKKLVDKGYDDAVAEQAVQQLADEGLQCDQRFSDNFVQSRINQGKGPVRIQLDLGQRGISDAVIVTAVDESAADWNALARQAKLKKFGTAVATDFNDKAKQMRFLQYRGFEPEQIQAAVGSDEE